MLIIFGTFSCRSLLAEAGREGEAGVMGTVAVSPGSCTSDMSYNIMPLIMIPVTG